MLGISLFEVLYTKSTVNICPSTADTAKQSQPADVREFVCLSGGMRVEIYTP